MKTRGAAIALILGAVLCMNPVQAESPVAPTQINPAARAIAKELGFDEAQVEQVEQGKVITRQLGEEGDKELAAILFALVPISLEKAVARFEETDFEVDATVLDWGSIDVPARLEDFEKLTLPVAELAKLAGDDVAEEFNFSTSELALLATRTARSSTRTGPTPSR